MFGSYINPARAAIGGRERAISSGGRKTQERKEPVQKNRPGGRINAISWQKNQPLSLAVGTRVPGQGGRGRGRRGGSRRKKRAPGTRREMGRRACVKSCVKLELEGVVVSGEKKKTGGRRPEGTGWKVRRA